MYKAIFGGYNPIYKWIRGQAGGHSSVFCPNVFTSILWENVKGGNPTGVKGMFFFGHSSSLPSKSIIT